MICLGRGISSVGSGSKTSEEPEGVEIRPPVSADDVFLFSPDALEFLADLHRKFDPIRQALLQRRVERQRRLDRGEDFDFLPETASIRDSTWTIAPVPPDLQDRRVEITGPTDRKMMINALNSGASAFMADFEDANTPTWANMVDGQVNLIDANARTI